MDHGENEEENLVRLLEQARKANLRLNSSKMNLRKSEVKFMGHLITKDGLKPDPEKVRAVQEFQERTFKSTRICQLLVKVSPKTVRSRSATERDGCKGSKVHLVPAT